MPGGVRGQIRNYSFIPYLPTRLKDRFLNERKELESQKNEMNINSKDITIQPDYCIKTISDICKFYSNADLSIKREILGSMFAESIKFSDNKVRTQRLNEVVKLLCPSIGTHEIEIRGRKNEKMRSSSKVNRREQHSNQLLLQDIPFFLKMIIAFSIHIFSVHF